MNKDTPPPPAEAPLRRRDFLRGAAGVALASAMAPGAAAAAAADGAAYAPG